MYNFVIVEFEPGRPQEELRSLTAWRAMLAEFVATFLFVFIGCGAAVTATSIPANASDPAATAVIALAFGLSIFVFASTIGNVSGGHINPAVTWAFIITNRLSVLRGLMYMIGQLAGAILGAGLLKGLVLGTNYGALGATTVTTIGVGQGLVIEAVLTFALVFVIFGTAVDVEGPGLIAPLAIGLTITASLLFAIPLTGGSLNPARSFGPAVWANQWGNHWIYWVGPFIGATLAAITYVFGLRRGIRHLVTGVAEPTTNETGRVGPKAGNPVDANGPDAI